MGNRGTRFLRKVMKVRKVDNKFLIKYLIYQQLIYSLGFSRRYRREVTRFMQKLHDIVSKMSLFVEIFVRKVRKSKFCSEEE